MKAGRPKMWSVISSGVVEDYNPLHFSIFTRIYRAHKQMPATAPGVYHVTLR
jgi:hypothetical protein